MYYKVICDIECETQEFGKIGFTALNNVEIDKSIDRISSSAKVKIPAKCTLIQAGERKEIKTADVFRRGDKVRMKLGYTDTLYDEFIGFVYKVNLNTPIELECEGYEYLLRIDCEPKTFAATTLKEVISYIVSGTEIKVDTDAIPEISMTNYVIPQKLNRLEALQQLKERYGLTIYFMDSTLYAGLDFVNYLGEVKYSIDVNTVKEGELKYQYADDVKLKVRAVAVQKNNTKIETEIGDKDGQQRTLFFYNITNKADLERMAEAEMKKYKYDGYTGKLTTFLRPYAAPGMVADIEDVKYSERSGKYEIRSVKTTVGQRGGRRVVEIGKTVSNGQKD